MSLATSTTTPAPDASTRPGLTSLIHTGRGIMTVQTEVIGEQLITIIDFRGRVLKTWRSSFGIDPNDVDAARRWHQQIEAEVRGTLARVTRREPDRGATVGACLFVEAMRSYAARDYVQAELLLGACEARLPGDARIAAARTRIRSRSAG